MDKSSGHSLDVATPRTPIRGQFGKRPISIVSIQDSRGNCRMDDAEITRRVMLNVMGRVEVFHADEYHADIRWFRVLAPRGRQKESHICYNNRSQVVSLFAPLTNDGDACAVLDKMVEHGWDISIVHTADYDESLRWCVEFGHLRKSEWSGSKGGNRNRAICIAALKSVEAWATP